MPPICCSTSSGRSCHGESTPSTESNESHPFSSSNFLDSESGVLLMTLDVCLDRALQSWILSFGPFARVISPERLAREIADQFDEARARYAS